jgi:flagellar hook-length control protein FliK
MMIQSSNLSTMLSGLESGGAAQPGLLAEGGNTEAFAASLMQQLASLQANLAKNANIDAGVLADLQAKAGALDGHAAGQEVQDFAALFGNALPTAKKIGQDIDLDDTLNALADVLQHLQGLGTETVDPTLDLSTVEGVKTSVAQALSVDTSTQADGQPDPAAIAAAMSAAMQEPQQSDIAEVAVQMPGAAVGDEALLALKKTMQSGNATSKHDVSVGTQAGGDKQSLALDGEMTGAMLNQDNASRNAGQDNQASSDKAEIALAEWVSQAKNIESDKSPSRMAADIAQLNRAVSAEKATAVPAMSRHLSHPEWNTELGEKLIWMHKQDIPSAELRLNPQHLGPISIKIDVNQDQATVAFTAQNAAVKEAIEAALPKLREMLGGQQLNLADVNVSQQQSEQRQPRDFFQAAGGQGQGSHPGQNDETSVPANQAGTDIAEEIEAGRAIASNGLLSLFA